MSESSKRHSKFLSLIFILKTNINVNLAKPKSVTPVDAVRFPENNSTPLQSNSQSYLISFFFFHAHCFELFFTDTWKEKKKIALANL